MQSQQDLQQIPVYDGLCYAEFLNNHLIPNQPLILSSTATSSWAARESWTPRAGDRPSEAGPSKPRLSALRRYAHHVVPVANTLKQMFSEFERTERPLGEVLDLWEAESPDGHGLYVKDWHLLGEIEKEGRGAEEVYHVPECFRDDWMNPSYCAGPRSLSDRSRPSDACDDFRFCYTGAAGTFTPLHKDVYSSYSWSANIVGRKRWWLFPPDRLDGLKDRHGEFVFDIRTLEGQGGGVQIIQQEGEVIFVPSGWYHQVENLDFCISINHNFISSATLSRAFTALCESQSRVEASISDIKPMIISRLGKDVVSPDDGLPLWEKEWSEEVQALLERDAGWNWKGFWECIRRNVQQPPAAAELSPPADLRDQWVMEVIGRYEQRRDWALLADVRSAVDGVRSVLRQRSHE